MKTSTGEYGFQAKEKVNITEIRNLISKYSKKKLQNILKINF